MNEHEQHLRMLAIFHYVMAGLAALCSLFPVIHLGLGIAMLAAPEKFGGGNSSPPAFMGWFFVIFASVFIIVGLTVSGCILAAGRFLAQRKHYTFCFVVACVQCAFVPLGTVLGVFTIIALTKDPVKQLFNTPEKVPAG